MTAQHGGHGEFAKNRNRKKNVDFKKYGCIAMVGGHGGSYIWEEVMLF